LVFGGNMVEMSSKTLSRLKTYIPDFWDYYQYSKDLKLALEKA